MLARKARTGRCGCSIAMRVQLGIEQVDGSQIADIVVRVYVLVGHKRYRHQLQIVVDVEVAERIAAAVRSIWGGQFESVVEFLPRSRSIEVLGLERMPAFSFQPLEVRSYRTIEDGKLLEPSKRKRKSKQT